MIAGYNKELTFDLATSLYRRAAFATFIYANLGFVFGSFIGIYQLTAGGSVVETVSFALIGLLVGIWMGRERTVSHRLQAQVALCFCEIEEALHKDL